MLDWEKDVYPVLQATYQAWQEESQGGTLPQVIGASGIRINQILGRGDDDHRTAVAIDRLAEGGYVHLADTRSMSSRYTPDDCVLTEKGLRLVAGWPGAAEETMVSRLISLVEERIASAPTPAERSAWQKVRDGILDVPQQVLVDVLTRVLTGGL
jgi:hypothetical protein